MLTVAIVSVVFCCCIAFGGPGPASYDIKSSVGSGVATSIRGRQSVPLREYFQSRNNVSAVYDEEVVISNYTARLYAAIVNT